MIDNSTKKNILEEILKSKSFANSKLNCKLLTYLVECSIGGNTPSEFSIAQNVFNKDTAFNPNEDTIVRVSVYNLRKKLERYYQNMGKNTKLRVKIPKGHYEVEFFNHSKESLKGKFRSPNTIFLTIIFVLVFALVYLLFKLPKNIGEVNYSETITEFHSAFINSEKSKIISLGNDFIYYSDFSEFNTTAIRKMIRNSAINSEQEFEKFKSNNPERESLKKLPFSFFNQAAVQPLPHLVKFMHRYNIDYRILSASTMNSTDLKSNDIVFVGSFWTLGLLDPVVKSLGINYNIIGKEELIVASVENYDSVKTYTRTGVPAFDHTDYSVFIKIPGPDNNEILIVASFFATGSVGTMKYITNEKNIKELVALLDENCKDCPPYFYAVFESTGFNREVFSTKLLQVESINPEIIKW